MHVDIVKIRAREGWQHCAANFTPIRRATERAALCRHATRIPEKIEEQSAVFGHRDASRDLRFRARSPIAANPRVACGVRDESCQLFPAAR